MLQASLCSAASVTWKIELSNQFKVNPTYLHSYRPSPCLQCDALAACPHARCVLETKGLVENLFVAGEGQDLGLEVETSWAKHALSEVSREVAHSGDKVAF